jgi:predicted nucleotidyltransferase
METGAGERQVRARIAIDQEQITAFCERHPIHKLALFGSVLRDDFHAGSDVDMVVQFEPGARISLFDMVDLEAELTEIVGRKVDLRTPAELSQYFRQRVLDEAEVLYVRG